MAHSRRLRAPSSESAEAIELLEERFPEVAGGTRRRRVRCRRGRAAGQPTSAAIASALAQVAEIEHVAAVTDPFETDRISADGRIGYAEIALDVPSTEFGRDTAATLVDALEPARADGLTAEFGGDAAFLNAEEESSGAEASGRPRRARRPRHRVRHGRGRPRADRPCTGRRRCRYQRHRAAGRRSGRLHRRADVRRDGRAGRRHRLRPVHRLPLPGEPRRRAGQRSGACPPPWARPARPSSSPAGPWSLAMAALVLTGVGFLATIGLATSIIVLFAVATALTLLPALLSLLGDRIDAGRVVGRRRAAKPAEATAWWRLAHRISARPWPYLVAASLLLLTLAAPALSLKTGFPDAGDNPTGQTRAAGVRPARRRLRTRLQRAPARRRRPAGHRAGRRGHPRAGRAASPPTPASRRSASRASPPTATPSSCPRCPPPSRRDPATLRTLERIRSLTPDGVSRDRPDRADPRPGQAAHRHPAAVHRRDPGWPRSCC